MLERKNKIIVISILVASIIVLSLIGKGLFEAIELSRFNQQVISSSKLTYQIMAFDAESYNAQNKILDYFYDPGEDKLRAFQKNLAVADDLLEDLASMARTSDSQSLYSGGAEDIAAIKDNMDKAKEILPQVLVAVEKHRKAEEAGLSAADLQKLSADTRKYVLESRAVFNGAGVNKQVDHFVQEQQNMLANNRVKITAIQGRIKLIFLALAGAYLVLMLFIAVWLWGVIKMVKEKNMDICKL